MAGVIERVVETGEKTPGGWRNFNLATDFQKITQARIPVCVVADRQLAELSAG
ncbi:hypothetical protein OG987_42225 [Streptomyces sp. NBC_01620]|uniref:hypothetical protein n=1 Tax=Streptomyces sp. NBC_01620 TaxID=2975902 RepID=UPI00386416CD|nr:hypothetical protein OG987_42225 [Streptomyces sp. NBC_01620]